MERTIKFASLRAPDTRDFCSLKSWIRKHGPLSEEEDRHLLGGTDFVALVEKEEEGWLDKIVELALSRWFPRAVGSLSILASYAFLILPENLYFSGATPYQRQPEPSFTQQGSH